MNYILEHFESFSAYIWFAYSCTFIGMCLFYLKTLQNLKAKRDELKKTQDALKSQPRVS